MGDKLKGVGLDTLGVRVGGAGGRDAQRAGARVRGHRLGVQHTARRLQVHMERTRHAQQRVASNQN